MLAARSGGQLEAHAYPGAHHDFDAPDTPQRILRGIGGTASGTATIGTHPVRHGKKRCAACRNSSRA
jgi:hypothetical protein